MITKDILTQYVDLREEKKDVENRIQKLQKEIEELESLHTEVDIVRGGEGGKERFSVFGIPSPEYSRKKTLLYARQTTLATLDMELAEVINEVEEFIASIDDSRIRRIIDLRFLQNMTWDQVAVRIGGDNSKDSVRMMFKRYIDNL